MVVSILGCGWLGSALGKHLVESGHQVNGSVTKPRKLNLLNNMGVQSFLLEINEDTPLDPDSGFWTSDALIISSNVKLDKSSGYVNGLKAVAQLLRSKNLRRIIVVSSTSVYGDSNSVISESAPVQPNTTSAQRLLEIEAIFQQLENTTVMRCGGLVGPGRMPGSFLAGRKDVPNGLAPVNLVHLNDCISLIETLLHTEESVGVLNAVAPDHPSRADFYTQAAAAQNLPLPEFVMEKTSWKIVDSQWTKKLGYQYQISNWRAWLEDVKSKAVPPEA